MFNNKWLIISDMIYTEKNGEGLWMFWGYFVVKTEPRVS